MGKYIQTETRGRVVVAKLSNPPHELLTGAMAYELDALVRQADADDNVGVVILTGTQPTRFLAHWDVAELLAGGKKGPPVSQARAKRMLSIVHGLSVIPGVRASLARTPAAGMVGLLAFHDTLLRMGRSGAIFIAAINGWTAGGGLELSLACDLRYLSDRGEIAQPEVLIGIMPGGGGTQRLARLIGRARALELMLTGRGILPDEAMELGLVTAVFPHEQFLESVFAVAEKLARRHKPTVAEIKRAVLDGGSLPLDGGLRTENAGFLATLGMPMAQRAMAAYVAQTEQTGQLPEDDPDVRRKLEEGTFIDFQG
jgi:enoyl-CoA hydratase/carnithine racemase